jgi:hypothetical protein
MIYHPPTLLEIRRSQGLYHTRAFTESRPEYAIRVLEHPILQTDNNKLAAFEPGLDQAPDILRMRKVQGGINLVQYVHGRWLEL